MLFTKSKVTPTMESIQEAFIKQAQEVMESQELAHQEAVDKAEELAKQAADEMVKADTHKNELEKASKFISNFSKLFE